MGPIDFSDGGGVGGIGDADVEVTHAAFLNGRERKRKGPRQQRSPS